MKESYGEDLANHTSLESWEGHNVVEILTYCPGMCEGLGIDQVIATVAEYLGLDSKLIGKKTKQRAIVLSRSIICALSVDRLMLTGVDIARRLNMTPSAVSRLVARGREETVLPKIERRLFGE